jgi:hypothetical protein
MADLTVNRTLVKSPPELWSEVSEVESLAHHLGEFGEIGISRLDPEHTVAWEGEHARGTVELEGSGWGTKVTLSADLALVETEPEPEPEPEPVAEESPLPWYRRLFGRRPAPAPESEAESEHDPETVVDPVRATAVLEDTLDHLGSAHHRPFSREG